MNILTTYLGFTGALAAALYGFLTWYERSHMSDGAKETLSLWLMGASKDTWTTQFCRLFDSIFSDNHTSLKCIIRSVIASLIAVAALTVLLGPVLGLTERMPGEQSFLSVLALGAVINLPPDYASLFQTRWILQKFKTLPSFFGQTLVLLLDLLMTGAIIWGGILAYHAIRGIAPPDFFEVIGGFTVYSIFFYSTFLTSIWAWLYCSSSWIMRLFSGKLSSALDVEKRPLQQLALISSLLLVALMLAPRALPGGSLESAICKFPGDQITYHCIRTAPNAQIQADYLSRLVGFKTFDGVMANFDNFFRDKDESKSLKEVISQQTFACDQESSLTCFFVAMFYRLGVGVEKSQSSAFHYFDKACKVDVTTACYNLGLHYLHGEGTEQSTNQAEKHFSQTCNDTVAIGCHNLALLLSNSSQQSAKRVLWAYTQSCKAGIAKSCTNLGVLYENGNGVNQSYHDALNFYTIACNEGHSYGCHNLGVLHYNGHGVEQSFEDAARLFKLACTGGYMAGCYNLGILYYEGRDNFPKNMDNSLIFMRRACNGGFEHKVCDSDLVKNGG